MSDHDLDELAAELAEFASPEKKAGRSARDERIIAGFEDIQRFVDEHSRVPQHGEDRDIFERLFAVRLDRLRSQPDCRALLNALDRQGLLDGEVILAFSNAEIDDDLLLAELMEAQADDDLNTLRHVRRSEDRREAEEIAERIPCSDFDRFKPLFEHVKRDIAMGLRQAKPIQTNRQGAIKQGEWFVVGGQTAYVADAGEEFVTEYDRRDSRLRVIYDNGTESNVLWRSFQRALHRDIAGRLITDAAKFLLGQVGDVRGDASGCTEHTCVHAEPEVELRILGKRAGLRCSETVKRLLEADRRIPGPVHRALP